MKKILLLLLMMFSLIVVKIVLFIRIEMIGKKYNENYKVISFINNGKKTIIVNPDEIINVRHNY